MLRAVHLRLSPAAPAAPSSRDGEARACYGIVVARVSLLLLCALVSAVGVVRAFAATGVLVLLLAPTDAFAVALAPTASVNASARPAPMVRLQTMRGGSAAASASGRQLLSCPCACGLMAGAGIGVLSAFAYEPNGSGVGGAHMCAVCLEDVRTGEMVRRLPACGHLFHEDCVDVWLRVHRTCSLCRRVLLPARGRPTSSSPMRRRRRPAYGSEKRKDERERGGRGEEEDDEV
uniref:RING-type E3 ubiquitin transferase n=1 Tax=Oryza punctata TaxID=4537 RepID=A0A0E0KCR2_ORYPU